METEMKSATQVQDYSTPSGGSKNERGAMFWIGWVLSVLVVALMLLSAFMKLSKNPQAVDGFKKAGYPESALIAIGIAEAACAIIYLIPQTSVLGAILLVGYLGGATNHHVRVGEAFYMPILVGVVAWVGIFLRDNRLRALLPLRS